MSLALAGLLGDEVILPGSGDGDNDVVVPLDSVIVSDMKQQIILYFSAHWCPPCRGFTPLLSKAYDEYYEKQKLINNNNKDNNTSYFPKETEIIFVSRDSDENAFNNYHKKEMAFPALPFDSELSEKLMTKYGVEGIPTMVAIDSSNGDVIQKDVDFRSLISSHGVEAFPLTPEKISQLNAIQEAKKEEALKKLHSGEIPFVATKTAKNDNDDGTVAAAATTTTTELRELLQSSEYVGIVLGDGDYSDSCYEDAKGVIEKLNKNKELSSVNRHCTLVYMGWNLFSDDDAKCNHSKLAETFDYSITEISAKLRDAMECILEGKCHASAPQLILLQKGTGLCMMDGKCKELGVPVVVSTDPYFSKMLVAGLTAFPWDTAAMEGFDKKEKEKVEAIKGQLKNMEFLTKKPEDGSPIIVQKTGDQRSLEERLFIGDNKDKEEEDAMIGLYFSAHWCPPCQMFTPNLVKCYETLKEAGKKFEIVFISSDSSKDEFEEYHKSMVTSTGDHQFLALDYDSGRDLNNCLSKIFDVGGFPELVLLKHDGTILNKQAVQDITIAGAEAFPWDDATMKRVRMEKEAAAAQKENDDKMNQVTAGLPVVKRVLGKCGSIKHDTKEKTLEFDSFSTAGVPDLYADSGVMYYEIDILNQEEGGIPQFGFSLKEGLEPLKKSWGEGVGDNKTSWGVDGVRGCKWYDGSIPFPGCSWDVGDTIGLAANIGTGMIAISKNGTWEGEDAGCGVVFHDEAIKQGVYPCFSGEGGYKIKYHVGNDKDMKHTPPADSLWEKTD